MKANIKHSVENYLQIFYALGFFSEIILIVWVACLLYDGPFFVVYLVGVMVSTILNQYIKNSWKDPRPSRPIPFLASEHFTGKKNYGMPSGHAQVVFFSFTFYAWVFYPSWNQPVLWGMASLCILCLWERWQFRNHTWQQLVVGAILGTMIATLVYYITLIRFQSS